MITIDEVYAAINPLPARLAEKGKAKPDVDLRIEANAGVSINMSWSKPHSDRNWEKDYQCFLGDTFDQALRKAVAFIDNLPTAEQAKLHGFMEQLGKLIDSGRADGIEVDYMNPLLDTMKRLSENVITYKPQPESAPY